MKISSKTEYALRTVLHLAMHAEKDVVPVGNIAAEQNIPEPFLAQILLSLKSLGIVRSRRGIAGGYQLAMTPESIPLDLVIQATDERFTSSQVPHASPPIAGGVEQEVLHDFWNETSRLLLDQLKSTTVRDLCNRVQLRRTERIQNYVI